MFLMSMFLIWSFDKVSLVFTLIFIFIETIVIITLIKIASICKIKNYIGMASGFVKNLISAADGVSYYSAERLVAEKFDSGVGKANEIASEFIERSVWRSFFCLALLFCVILVAYIIQEDYWTIPPAQHSPIFCLALALYAAFLMSVAKYKETKPAAHDYLEQYVNEEQDYLSLKVLTDENLFVAFHGVYFRSLEESPKKPAIQNLTFSVLPGEFLSITGENVSASCDIFNLLLKYLAPQSGNIYISGTSIKNIKTDSLRKEIGMFRQNFGIIDGTVHDNISVASEDKNAIVEIAKRLDLVGELGVYVFDDSNIINVPQSILFKIQIARIGIRQPSLILIESPPFFEDRNAELIFMEFVESIAQRKTVIISTTCLKFIIYSDKTIYLGRDDEAISGTHASLAKNRDYQQYISTLGRM
jgi:ABC-type transport system involved in cytochrome bd biosynthesis fused ATPase/permease subunit